MEAPFPAASWLFCFFLLPVLLVCGDGAPVFSAISPAPSCFSPNPQIGWDRHVSLPIPHIHIFDIRDEPPSSRIRAPLQYALNTSHVSQVLDMNTSWTLSKTHLRLQ
ncbi:hypothetical protein B0I35DRAFT_122811 [Stachybotrys elegans]|uniref:Uncharacterized protein n=1 Tax=Stachybotrys elegans TaxID=80388 RepID=A0A8K0SY98_9HYPO|nr:hypothetical protein B0I35DRAFT_122811 [Stachybotrys elegans]